MPWDILSRCCALHCVVVWCSVYHCGAVWCSGAPGSTVVAANSLIQNLKLEYSGRIFEILLPGIRLGVWILKDLDV